MRNISWLKIYLIFVVMVSFVFLGLNLLADVEQTPHILKNLLKGEYQQVTSCPNFIDITSMTMKDQCTGVVWARHELPTYQEVNDQTPGYNWTDADTACKNLAKSGERSLFRLPTVEELLSRIKYQCDQQGCATSMALVEQDNYPFFSDGIYWSGNDFNERPEWTDPTAVPPGKAARDYKRSVNLLNGEVDTPVYNKDMRLNVWCLMDKQPQEFDKQFVSGSFTSFPVADGTGIQGGRLKTTYNRQCTAANVDTDCVSQEVTIGTACENNRCVAQEDITFPGLVTTCRPDYHVEGDQCILVTNDSYSLCSGGTNDGNRCVSNANCSGGTCVKACPTSELATAGVSAYEIWKGNIFNGFRMCNVHNCQTGYHKDPISDVCVADEVACNFTETNNWTILAVQTWLQDPATGLYAWGPCHAKACTYSAQLIDNQGDLPGSFNYDPTCQCLDPAEEREEVCVNCADGNHYEDNVCVSNLGADCSTVSEVKQQIWQGGLFAGYYQCTFQSCQTGYHQEEVGGSCLPNTLACTFENYCVAASNHSSYEQPLNMCSKNSDCTTPGFDYCLIPSLDPYGLVATAKQIWDNTTQAWSACAVDTCTLPAIKDGSLLSCTCPTGYVIRTDGFFCTKCGNGVVDAGEACDVGCTSTTDPNGFGSVATCAEIPIERPIQAVDALFVVDTSMSMVEEITNLCNVKKEVTNTLITGNNVNLNNKIFGISDKDTEEYPPTPGGLCKSRVSADVLNQIYIQNQEENICFNIKDDCGNYTQATCPADHCAWDGLVCSRNQDYCNVNTDKGDCTPLAPVCAWEPTLVNGCGNGYVYSDKKYDASVLPFLDRIVTSKEFCSEDWVSSTIELINEYSNTNGTLDWTPASERMIIIIFDEAPYTGANPWEIRDYEHMQASKRTRTLGQSLIAKAQANNVRLTLIFTTDLNMANTDCSGWTFDSVDKPDEPGLDYSKYCAFKKIATATGGSFVYGSTVMTNYLATANTITQVIVDALSTPICDNSGFPDGIMDCQVRY